MTDARYDILGIGNAIVDIIARADDDFLVRQNMNKGGMALIDEARATAIYDSMGPAVESSGGSAANTIVGAANFGARAAFIGKVKDDAVGKAFMHDIRAAGVTFETPAAKDGPSTARCYVLVTPDGERTMNTYLGAAQDLSPADIDPARIAASSIVYLEGYLWDPANAKEAFLKAAQIAWAVENGLKVASERAEFFSADVVGIVDYRLVSGQTHIDRFAEIFDIEILIEVAAIAENGKSPALARPVIKHGKDAKPLGPDKRLRPENRHAHSLIAKFETDIFGLDLGFAVRPDADSAIVFEKRMMVGNAIDRGRGNMHDALYAGLLRLFENGAGAVDIGRKNIFGLIQRQRRGAVHDRVAAL